MPEKSIYFRHTALKKLEIHQVFLRFFALSDANICLFQVLCSFEVVTFLMNK